MKKLLSALGRGLIYLLLVPLFLLALVIFLPFVLINWLADYPRYKRSRYYRDFGEKYSFMRGASSAVKLYGAVREQGLALEYHRHEEDGVRIEHFTYRDVLILPDYQPCFDDEKGVWTEEVEDEYVALAPLVQADIDLFNGYAQGIAVARALLLVDGEFEPEDPSVLAGDCFDVLPTNDPLIETLQAWIEQQADQAPQ